MKTVSIGTMRDDGDFAILATLNNNDGHMADNTFASLVQELTLTIANYTGEQILFVERQDAPDYVSL